MKVERQFLPARPQVMANIGQGAAVKFGLGHIQEKTGRHTCSVSNVAHCLDPNRRLTGIGKLAPYQFVDMSAICA